MEKKLAYAEKQKKSGVLHGLFKKNNQSHIEINSDA